MLQDPGSNLAPHLRCPKNRVSRETLEGAGHPCFKDWGEFGASAWLRGFWPFPVDMVCHVTVGRGLESQGLIDMKGLGLDV